MARRLVWGGLARLGLVAGVLTLAAAVLCQRTLHVPHVSSEPIAGAREVTIVTRDRVALAASFLESPAHTGRCVLALHGIGDTRAGMADFADMFLAAGYAVLLPDSRAHGESGGAIITYGLFEKLDALDWVHWLKQQGCAQVYGLGESLGGAVLIQTVALEPVFRAIVAECPYSSLESVAEYRVGRMSHLPAWAANAFAWPIIKSTEVYARAVYGISLGSVSPVNDLARTSTPVLLIHGKLDTETPPKHSELLARANPHAGGCRVQGTCKHR